jgi:hypothetical protein
MNTAIQVILGPKHARFHESVTPQTRRQLVAALITIIFHHPNTSKCYLWDAKENRYSATAQANGGWWVEAE